MGSPIILQGQQRTTEWYQAKAGRITGTRFASAMAKRGTAARDNLVIDLAWERVFGPDTEERFVSGPMQCGIDTEPEAFDWYAFTTDATCTQPMFVIHGDYDFVGVSPDLLVNHDGMAQVKCPQRRAHLGVIQTGKLPPEYRWQVLGEMWTCQRDWSDFVSYHQVLRGKIVRVDRDEAAIAQLEEACLRVNEEAEALVIQLQKLKGETS